MSKTKDIPNFTDLMNNLFSAIAENVVSNLLKRDVREIEIRDAIGQLKNKANRDCYDMDANLINKIKNSLIIPLAQLFNEVIRTGKYPD